MLSTSGMSKDDYQQDPDTLLKVLKFQEDLLKEKLPPRGPIPAPPPIPSLGPSEKANSVDQDSDEYSDEENSFQPLSYSEKPNLSRTTSSPHVGAITNQPSFDEATLASFPSVPSRYSSKPIPLPPGAKNSTVNGTPPIPEIKKPLPSIPPASKQLPALD